MIHRKHQHGQILVIFAGGLVVMMLIAALVIDLGFVFMAKRAAQNAADPGAIAAARFIRPTADTSAMRAAACFYARENGFFAADANCTNGSDPAGATLTVHFPPSASAGNYVGRPGFVQVVVARPHNSFLAGVVGITKIAVSSSAVAAFSGGDSNSNSLIALDTASCPGGSVSGGAKVTIDPTVDPATGLDYVGGYVHINSPCGSVPMQNGVCGNGEGAGALKMDGSGSNLTAPHVYVVGTCIKANNNAFNSALTEGAVQIGNPLGDLEPPPFGPDGQCGIGGPFTRPTGEASKGCDFPTGIVQLYPGTYYGGWKIGPGVELKLAPGIYHIAGGGISLNAGGSIVSVDSLTGSIAPIMIFNTDNPTATCPGGAQHQCQQSIDFTASTTLRVRGLDSGPYRGIMMWQDGDGSDSDAPVTLGGQTTLEVAGTIYAPKAEVKLVGGSAGTGIASVQIIAWRFDIGGGATLTMPYDPTQLYQFDQKGLVR